MTNKNLGFLMAVGITGAVLFAGCTATAHIEKDNAADFTKYQTYAWVEKYKTADSTAKQKGNSDLAEANIRTAVNEQLQKSGWREVKANPDIMVNYELLVEKNLREQRDPVYTQSFTRSYYNRYTGRINTFYYPSRFVGYESYSTSIKEGTVTITMIDNKTDKTIWQGWTTTELNSNKFTGREIDQNVKTIFKKFDTGRNS